MKTVTPAMAAHLKGETTTLTTCWRITRQDGKVFHYTELDEDVPYLGDVYKSASGFNKSAMKSSANFAVDEMEVTGFLRDDGIADDELKNGAFDFAKVEVFMVNYEDESMGSIKLRYGYFGEVKTVGSGAFSVELRGLVDLLSQRVGNTYLNECRQDLGDPKCGIKLQPDEHRPGARYIVGQRILFPVSLQEDNRPRVYPDNLNPELGVWNKGYHKTEDINMSSFSGRSKVVGVGTNDKTAAGVLLSSLGLSASDISSGRYKAILSGQYYIYWQDSAGYVTIDCQKPYFNTGFYTNIENARVTRSIPNLIPERRWRPFSIEIDIHPQATRLNFTLGTNTGTVSRYLCFDEMMITIVKEGDVAPNFADFGGVEFEATTTGRTSTGAVEFDPNLGALTQDGGVIWKAVNPVYRFLGEVTVDSIRTNQVKSDPIAVADGWFDWGVIKFLTGQNVGRAVEVMDYNHATGEITTALPLPYQSKAGDLFSIQAGCNKTASECINKFKNILNFRGHPRVPGQGQYFKIAGL
ncbi:DUF2163 domain-containing protein [Sinorhizobium meliloti]|uniref:DUF2163 domain-containing protein n=1 Tax=Rhizobium meliloti TaxID=382 RepID=UPI0012959F4F|nr:DUF2163 domain-containing protein [Sinorhizobium meliloti]MDW9491663.1 DUF2163 domain-containing protein [Sinorhizobium meliloti]MQV02929.1 DUF2163 domain-containing protein [Sinorhizobium meliloti]